MILYTHNKMSESTQQQIEYLQQLQHVFSPFLVQDPPPPPQPIASAPSFTSIFTNILQTYHAHQQRRVSSNASQGSLLFNTLLTISEQLLQTHLSSPEENPHELVTILLTDLEPGNDEHELYRNYKDCSICFEPIQTAITITPCKHGYHEECIKKLLQHHPSCPICRHEC
jgi:superfamily I DNA and/or RNA helicase